MTLSTVRPQERVHGRRPCAVDVAELRIARGEIECAPVLQAEAHPAAHDLRYLGDAAVDKPEAGVVAGPANAVADAQLDVLAAVDLDAAGARGEAVGIPRDRPAVLSLQ